ncbi:uncharacterized protein LOC134204430 [Armigeres subalbatus]|uniref:uncharacterized protein LOC134204430 n=1 Tax=Armigeres subalbatus TaxID=124917 RepID=UPI002ED6BD23
MDVLRIFPTQIVLLLSLHFITVFPCGVIWHIGENGAEVLREPFAVWPWHVAVLNNTNGYLASGALISEWFVLTVAHVTFTSEQEPKLPNEFQVVMGITDLGIFQQHTKKANISTVIRYGGYDQKLGKNDLALLKMTDAIKFTNYISPVCLWPTNDFDDKKNQGMQMTIVGWGLAKGNKMQELALSEANVTVGNFEGCFKHSASSRVKNYCLKSNVQLEVCLENSDGEIYIKYKDVWHIRGIVTRLESNSKMDDSCEKLRNIQFMELSYYQKWIEKHAFPTKHNLLGLEDCGVGSYVESENSLTSPPQQTWIAQLAYLFWGRFNVTDCHGVLIHPEFVITSSKCTENRKYRTLLHVILGSSYVGWDPYNMDKSGVQAIEISEHLFSEMSRTIQFGFDMNVLRLAQKADITDSVKPVCLPPVEEPVAYYNLITWNHRAEHPKQLKSSTMRMIPFDECRSEYLKLEINITSDNFLACYEACQITKTINKSLTCEVPKVKSCAVPISGGPLFYTKHDGLHSYTYLAGVKSFGPANCQDNLYEIFNDVISFREEIEELIRWKAWFSEDDDMVSHDFDEISHTLHFELDDKGNVVGEDGHIMWESFDTDSMEKNENEDKLPVERKIEF